MSSIYKFKVIEKNGMNSIEANKKEAKNNDLHDVLNALKSVLDDAEKTLKLINEEKKSK